MTDIHLGLLDVTIKCGMAKHVQFLVMKQQAIAAITTVFIFIGNDELPQLDRVRRLCSFAIILGSV
eukprot:1092671-Ditylum_brightwellii.AAC.1